MKRSIRFPRCSRYIQTARPVLSVLLLALFLISCLPAIAPAYAEEPAPLVMEGVAAMLVDADRGQIIYAKQETERLHIGIAAKLMTVLLAMENTKSGALITASSEAADMEGALLNLRVGEKYALENLAFAAMLSGANDACVALAEYAGGTMADFVVLMNAKAASLGMHNTHFENPTGMNDDNQYTTAADLSLFMRQALENPGFSNIFGTQAKPWYDDRKTTLLTNRNAMFWSYDGTDGGVSGSNDPKLESIITTATRNSMRLICIVLDVPSGKNSTDCSNLLTYGFSNYRYGTLVSAGQTLKGVTVEDQPLNLLARTNEFYVYPIGQNFVKDLTITVDDMMLKPPVLKNIPVGKAVFTLADKTMVEVDLVPEVDILPKQTRWQALVKRLQENREILLLVLFLALVEVVWMLSRLFALIVRHLPRHRRDGLH